MTDIKIRRFFNIVVVFGFAFFTLPLQALDSLSEEDLKPFCSNKNIWSSFDVSESECMKEAVACSKNNTASDVITATEQLYACVFSALGIDLPEDEDEEDWNSEEGGEYENYFDENMNAQGEYQ